MFIRQIEIAKQNPEARITGLHWAMVLEVALRNARAAGVADRYTRLPGSAFDVEFGGPYHAVLLTNFLHHFDRSTCVTLLKKTHGALRPGGVLATLEFVPDENQVSPMIPTFQRFLENQIRAAFGFRGSPIWFKVRARAK